MLGSANATSKGECRPIRIIWSWASHSKFHLRFSPITRAVGAGFLLSLALASSVRAAPEPIDIVGKTCLTAGCHSELAVTQFVHPPVMQGDCQVCHVQSDGSDQAAPEQDVHQFTTRPPRLGACGECHQDLSLDRAVVHDPFRDDCTACHDPHGGSSPAFLVEPTAGTQREGLCMSCHAELIEGMKVLHGPVALELCSSCHDPHASDLEGLLTKPARQLCDSCHTEFGREAHEAVSIHEPAAESCSRCHDPHGGNRRAFLPVEQGKLCAECHDQASEKAGAEAEPKAFAHLAMTENRECSDCHDPHWSANPKLLAEPSIGQCLRCHDREQARSGGGTVEAVGERIRSSAFRHGPIEQGDCTACHAAHGNDDPRLMKLEFPDGIYVPYSEGAYALCFSCHDSSLVQLERTRQTGFRDGDRNLHFVHVNREKGRSCRACHHEHASDQPFQIRQSVPFGRWELAVGFEPTPTGGACLTGCHDRRGYDRNNVPEAGG